MNEVLNVLCLEDSTMDAQIIHDLLMEAGYNLRFDCTAAEKEYVSLLRNHKYDVIISDFKLPGFNGFAALKWAVEICPGVPFICVSGTIGESLAVELLKKGALDYILKDKLERLPSAIQRALDEAKEKKARQEAERWLRIYSETQSLLLHAGDVKEIYSIVADKVSELIGHGVVFTTLLNESSQTIGITAYKGLDVPLDKLIKTLRIDPIKTAYHLKDITEEELKLYRSGKLEKLDGGVYDLATRRIPKALCQLAERMLKVEHVFTMGFIWHGVHFGGLVILAQSDISIFKATIELLVNQSVTSINRIRAETALRNSEEKFSVAFKTSPYAITITKPEDGRFIEVNNAFYTMIGFTPEEAYQNSSVGMNLWYNMEDRNHVVKELLEGRSVTDQVFRFRKKNGEIITGLFSAQLIRIQDKTYILSSINDITERKRVEDVIDNERRLLRTLIDNLPDQIFVKDANCRKIIANKADVSNIGFREEAEVIGKTDIELFPGPTGERGYDDDKKVINSGKALLDREEDFIDKNGGRRWLLTSKIPVHDKEGKVTGLVGIGHDITQRKEADEALRQSYTFIGSLLKTIPFGMHIVDQEGNVLFRSERFKELFGDVVNAKKCWKLLKDDHKQCENCPLAGEIAIGETNTYETHGVLGGKSFEISYTGMIYRDKKAMLEIFVDITERKEKELELIRAKEKAEESDQLKTSFLHNISHEIRTPMNAIVGFSGFLNDPDLLPEKRKQFTDIVTQSSYQLLSIITDIISISTIEAGQERLHLKNINVNSKCKLIYEQFARTANSKNISFRFNSTLADHDAIIMLDETKFMQVLTNLLDNAFKFIKQGHVYYGCSLKNGYLEFYVEDTGIGIHPDMHQEIFKRFRQVEVTVTRLYGGSGLGLAIVKAYVELHGGKIWLNSEIGKGSVFYFTIPYKKVVQESIPENQTVIEETAIDSIKPIALLIAEDEDLNFVFLQELLSDLNFIITRALNGIEAVELCKTNKDLDLVLMDLKMPVMDGYEATKQIRQFNSVLPIIAQTAYSTEADKTKALTAGCNDFISKPFKQGQLISKITEQLNSK